MTKASVSTDQNLSNSQPTPNPYTKTPKLLLILDGFGIREEIESNAIAQANTPNFDQLWADTSKKRVISASGMDVGLPGNQMGNSEVGHMNIGAGRVLYQDLTKITKSIADGDFKENKALVSGISQAVTAGTAVHIFGLLSPGGVHSHEDHIHALASLAVEKGAKTVYIHAFLDGRDTAPKSAAESIQKLEAHLNSLRTENVTIVIATMCGRFYAMDRDKRWDRVEAAYNAIVEGKTAFQSDSALAGLEAAYEREETDEFVQSTCLLKSYNGMNDGDVAICANFRSDRAKEICAALYDDNFSDFSRQKTVKLAAKITMTHYSDAIPADVAFPSEVPEKTLGEIVSKQGLKQLRLAETEKYAHVTFFMNAGLDDPWPQEDRILVKSPNVRTYDEAPAMSLEEVTDHLCNAIESQSHDLIICNFANADMVGHTGNFDAAVQAIQAIDKSLGRLKESLSKVNGEALITADHGNAEQMQNPATGQPHTAHTSELVPLMYIGPNKIRWKNIDDARLSDLAPSILYLMNIAQPKEMTGRCLLNLC